MRRIGSILAALMLAVSVHGASAQSTIQVGPSQPGGPPVAVGPSWKYERRGSDVHMFICQEQSCNPASRVSYRIYARNDAMTLESFRREQEAVAKALTERAPPGMRIEVLSVDGDNGKTLPRIYKAKRLQTSPDGRKEYVVSAVVLGQGASASVISSAPDEKTADANHAIFALAVTLFVNRSSP